MPKSDLVLVLTALFTGSTAAGASYQQRDGTIVDPIPACSTSLTLTMSQTLVQARP